MKVLRILSNALGGGLRRYKRMIKHQSAVLILNIFLRRYPRVVMVDIIVVVKHKICLYFNRYMGSKEINQSFTFSRWQTSRFLKYV